MSIMKQNGGFQEPAVYSQVDEQDQPAAAPAPLSSPMRVAVLLCPKHQRPLVSFCPACRGEATSLAKQKSSRKNIRKSRNGGGWVNLLDEE